LSSIHLAQVARALSVTVTDLLEGSHKEFHDDDLTSGERALLRLYRQLHESRRAQLLHRGRDLLAAQGSNPA
jgi:hypothetical protein